MLFSFFQSSRHQINFTKSKRSWSKFSYGLLNLCLGLSLGGVLANQAQGAEKIYLDYGPLQFSLSVESLIDYAQNGKIKGELRDYARFFTPEQLKTFREALVTTAEITPLAVAQFLYSYQGEKILQAVSQVVQTKSGQPGFYAIRSALILAAAEEEGLTPLNFLRKFPTYGIRINSRQGFEIVEYLSSVIQQTGKAIAAVEQQASQETEATTIVDLTPLPQLKRPGELPWRKQELVLRDRQRNRTLPVDLYLPRVASLSPLPLVIISHGLGSDRTTFAYLATHLVSHGFAVAVPEHPGSNASQIEALLNGFASQVTPPRELIDRPLDIQFLLDELETDYGKQINIRQVGIIGQSFGGYTALAVAGAQIDFEHLAQDCENFDDSLNASLLLQCLALELPNQRVNLRERRIAAAIAINPLTSAIFGQEGMSQIEIPTMIVSGSADPVTPALSEQIEPFTWLTTEKKYLVLLRGGTHFSTLNESSGSIPIPEQAIGPNPQVAHGYIQQLGLVFFNTYVADLEAYSRYLNADYAAAISQETLPVNLVRSLACNPNSSTCF